MKTNSSLTAHVPDSIKSPQAAFDAVEPGRLVAGVTDGTWSLIDAILHLQGRSNAKKLAIATWTAAKSNIEQARRLERLSGCQIRFLVDRSFQTRQPDYCQFLRDTFGDEVIPSVVLPRKICTIFGWRFRYFADDLG